MAKTVNIKINKNLFWASVVVIIIVILGIASLLLNYFAFLRRAHSSFDNYYAFRGCVQLLQKTTDSGICKTDSGQTIKIVKFNNRWYLDGDLPSCMGNFCF